MKIKSLIFIFLFSFGFAQHNSILQVRVNPNEKILQIKQELTYVNATADTIKTIVFNDWNNAFSSKTSGLARRFSDEFIRAFHLAKDEDRGYTKINNAFDSKFQQLKWHRNEDRVDIVYLDLVNPILPFSNQKITLSYIVKIPNDRFTKYGFNDEGRMYLKNWFLSPTRYENRQFVIQSNENLDDISNAPSDYEIEFEIPKNYTVTSDLNANNETEESTKENYIFKFKGSNKFDVTAVFTTKQEFVNYKNDIIEVSSNFNSKIEDVEKAVIIDKITRFVNEKIGKSPRNKLIVSQEDYSRQPFYGLNQLPSFLSPFTNEFMFELMFLKTYLNNYLKSSLQLTPRKEQWIYDGIQVFLMMQYIDEFHPEKKMTGSLSQFKLLKSFHFVNLDFNQQYNYLYMLMARKNLDQPLNEPKNRLIKFNEQIANKYRAGLSFKYLDSYLEKDIVLNSIQEFIELNKEFQTNKIDFETILKKNTEKDINWFFRTLIETRELIDFKFGKITKTEDKITIKVKNKTNTNVPISLYQLRNDSVISKIWIENIKKDTILVFDRENIDKFVLNYKNEVPEYNLRNNWKSLGGFLFNNRPLKLNFYTDLEEPHFNQLFYVPEFEFNLYDGIAIGPRLNNKSLLNKPFNFSVAPYYSTNTGKIIGNFSVRVDDYIRDEGKLYRIIYSLSGIQSHYAPNAKYTRFIPSIQFLFRDKNLRTNKKEFIQIRQLFIDKEASSAVKVNTIASKYSVFSASYGNIQSESTKHFSINNQVQISNSFGNITSEINYRKLFENNRQLSLRLFAGNFIYRSTGSNFFSFGLDKPTDYTFQTNLIGRSESTGLFSQQFVSEEGGFKSRLKTRYANQWMTTINASFNIWNWVQVYGDVGLLKNKFMPTEFVYDSGIHLNLVPDYFELFLPVYSKNGFELNDDNYGQKIRFIITISPKTLISLFTRKWF
ncbi:MULTISPECIES: aminopeptidase [Flavobacterium]|uniref:Aminopeptidase n=1 Tax=Flavobacterium jumunjinense TaxID=998845 RepID=A0ABV5GQQ0_9FLAO|nr:MULTISPECIES: aminopeptidase [Flavobacterium]